MIIKTNTDVPQIKTSEQFQELEFGVKSENMGLILEILRSKMYRNPIGSITREIASNARDANREAGKGDLPIEIAIQESIWLDSDLVVAFKDQGPGISPERMGDVFVNYGASTKRDSNEQTGGFGLGAKTPFSYSDNFSIVTVVDGIEYTYTAAIEEGQRGKLYLLEKKETEESNGTSIIVPIKEEDRGDFEEECVKSTFFWDIRPKYSNFDTIDMDDYKLKVLYEHDNCSLIDQNLFGGYSNKCGLLIDGIYYQIDSSIIGWAGHSYDNMILLKFDIGELTISANRESVQYDTSTTEVINKRFKEFVQHLKDEVQNYIDESPNYIQACINYQYLKNCTDDPRYKQWEPIYNVIQENGYNDEDETKFTYDSKPVISEFRYLKTKDGDRIDVQIGEVDKDRTGKEKRRKVSYFEDELNKYPIYFLDKPKRSAAKDRTILKNSQGFIVIAFIQQECLKFSEKPLSIRKSLVRSMRTMQEFIKLFTDSGYDIKTYSEVKGTVAPRRTGEVKEKSLSKRVFARQINPNAGKYCRGGGYRSRGHYESKWNVLELYTNDQGILEGNYVYVPVEREGSGICETNEVNEAIKWAHIIEHITKREVVFVTGKFAHFFKNHLTLEKAVAKLPEDKLKEITAIRSAKKLISLVEEYEGLVFYGEFKKTFDFANGLKEKAKDKSFDLPTDLAERYPLEDQVKEIETNIELIKERYPLLEHYRDGWNRDKKDYNEYIRLVDTSKDQVAAEMEAEEKVAEEELAKGRAAKRAAKKRAAEEKLAEEIAAEKEAEIAAETEAEAEAEAEKKAAAKAVAEAEEAEDGIVVEETE